MEDKKTLYIVYDFTNDLVQILDTKEEVCEFTGTDLFHFSENIKNKPYINGQYAIYSLEECIKHWHKNTYIELPRRFLQKIHSEAKQKILSNIINKVKKEYPSIFKLPLKIYVFNADLKVIRILEGHKEAAEYFNITIGSVKGRLHRAVDKETVQKYKMCKAENYNQIFK